MIHNQYTNGTSFDEVAQDVLDMASRFIPVSTFFISFTTEENFTILKMHKQEGGIEIDGNTSMPLEESQIQ
jgi:hypothetical protein